jgi:hypothetical protein
MENKNLERDALINILETVEGGDLKQKLFIDSYKSQIKSLKKEIMRTFRHKRTGIIGTLEEDGHLHFERSGGECSAHETIWKGFVENSCDWEEIKQPLLTTYDGVELFEGDILYVPEINCMREYTGKLLEFEIGSSCVLFDDLKIFADKNKAEEYIKQNTLTLTTKDGKTLKFGDIFYTVDVDKFKVFAEICRRLAEKE